MTMHRRRTRRAGELEFDTPSWSQRLLGGALICAVSLGFVRCAAGDESVDPPDRQKLIAAIERGLPLVQQAAARYPEHRKCFSCHHQTLPMLAIVAARHSGVAVDEAVLESQAEFTHASFERELDDLRAGKGIGGKALTVSYGLWSLSLAGRKPDDVTEAMVTYLLKTQQEDGHWGVHSDRPPLEESSETTTVLSLIGMQKYASDAQKSQVEAAKSRISMWFDAATPESHEDKISRLWSMKLLDRSPAALDAARREILAAQRDDGGWAQLESLESDAYATGQTLCVLLMTGTSPADPAFQRGIEFLLKTQQDDGSWFVKSRSKPVQVYFDNGDPHGKDQFISTPASCWALVALAMGARDHP
jgi:N-acyl-D-amino-acid deacylase